MTVSNPTESPQLKQCLSGDDCLHEDGPLLPLSEYYSRKGKSGPVYQARCKPCHRNYSKHKNIDKKRQSFKKKGYLAEEMAVEKFRSLGIYAVMGRTNKAFKNTDIVLWGCIRVEVKATSEHDGIWTFNLGNQREGFKADLVLLMPFKGDMATFHLFPADHPVFYKYGKVKAGVQLIPYAHHRKNVGTYLSLSLMSEYKDAWHLVEQVRERIIGELRAGEYDPKKVNAPKPVMRKLL